MEHFSWQSVFFINVPVGILALVAAAVVIPESRDTARSRRLDPGGLAAGTAAVTALTYALIEGSTRGWTDAWILASFGAAAGLLAVFIAIEDRSAAPMLPLALFRHRTFSAAHRHSCPHGCHVDPR